MNEASNSVRMTNLGKAEIFPRDRIGQQAFMHLCASSRRFRDLILRLGTKLCTKSYGTALIGKDP
jgi:hypothetical protein